MAVSEEQGEDQVTPRRWGHVLSASQCLANKANITSIPGR